uniref:Uncharacterized protein n=1 Tax=Avena sativa TaxID=4498 RepID=A0ACD5U9P4_AVESA
MLQLGNSMKPKGWVDAWLINVFCRKLFRDNHPSKTKKHFFFNTISDFFLEKWKSEEAKDIWHKRALESFIGANRAFKLHLSNALFFPSIYNRHWFVLLIDIKYCNFIFLDSYFSEDSTFHKTVGDVMIQNFIKTWHEAGLKEMNFQTYGRAYPNVPKQITGNDCGVFVMKFMEVFVARNQSKCNFSHLDIPLFRVKYTHDILMSRHNMERDAKDLASMFEC